MKPLVGRPKIPLNKADLNRQVVCRTLGCRGPRLSPRRGPCRLDVLECGDVSPLSLGATRRAHPRRPRAVALQGAALLAHQSDVSWPFRVDNQRSPWFRQRGSHNHWRQRNRTAGWLQKRPIFRVPFGDSRGRLHPLCSAESPALGRGESILASVAASDKALRSVTIIRRVNSGGVVCSKQNAPYH